MFDVIRSSSAKVSSGVPQGTVLGPHHFIICVKYIVDVIKHCTLKIFADDSKLQKAINGMGDRTCLQSDLFVVLHWAEKYKMLLNEDKFNLIHFRKEDNLKLRYALPSSDSLMSSTNTSHLGVIVDDKLSWSPHVNSKVDLAHEICSWILRTFWSRDAHTIILLYSTFARPHLEYC
ncbi:uncharacterized protein LOC115227543 [Octopus sinensis]|uniref:Uncharacterized protein LOC115227543 n=1 Tax=Octopus sinensis TaxID=2607531 RepID=A0A6P7TPS6_9MOLL|nr:uncharacterized protein LOC115227543 [Octopus sinensis]